MMFYDDELFDARCVDTDTVLGFLVVCTFLFVYAIDKIATSIDPCLLPFVVSGRSSLFLIGVLWCPRWLSCGPANSLYAARCWDPSSGTASGEGSGLGVGR
jgi:hypothetical protein